MIKTYFCPGRVNIIGEHLDYNGGSVLPAAISLGIRAKVKILREPKMIFRSQGMKPLMMELHENWDYNPLHEWANYPKGIVRQFHAHFPIPSGLEISYESTLPVGSGLSSSAAIEVLTMYILCDIYGKLMSRRDIALACQAVENMYIGVNCGIMDQYAVANGRKNAAMLLNCQTVKHTYIPFETGKYKLLILDTCKPSALWESKYNERRAECEAALAIIQGFSPECSTLAQAEPTDLAHIQDIVLKKRALHVLAEQNHVKIIASLLQLPMSPAVGNIFNLSHQSLRNFYEVTGNELDTIVSAAQAVEGCIGARMMGEGMGGCAIALVHETEIMPFIENVSSVYFQKMGYACKIYSVEVVDGVGEIAGT